MNSFSAFRHVGGEEIRFVGHSWEDGGLRVDSNGDPTHDARGNTIARFTVTEIDARDGDLLAAAYSGEELPDRDGFINWMAHEGVAAQVRQLIADRFCS